MAELRKIPPVTRFLCASSLAVTLPVMLNLVSPYKIIFVPKLVLRHWELWRVFTSFFFGSTGINYLFDLVMLYRNSDQLESRTYPRRSADYAWQLLAASAAIIALNVPISSYLHSRPLTICLTYLSASLAPPGSQTSIMGLISIPVVYLPYLMIGMDFLMAGPSAVPAGISGLVAGHLWWWGVWGASRAGTHGVLEHYARAPQWMRRLFGEQGWTPGNVVAPGAGPIGGVHVMPPRGMATRALGGSTTSGYRWGSGNRLGDK